MLADRVSPPALRERPVMGHQRGPALVRENCQIVVQSLTDAELGSRLDGVTASMQHLPHGRVDVVVEDEVHAASCHVEALGGLHVIRGEVGECLENLLDAVPMNQVVPNRGDWNAGTSEHLLVA